MTNDYARSLIRTIVPVAVGALVGWFATRGVDLDHQSATVVVDAVVTLLFYGSVRAAENRWPKAGWLLGVPGAPAYGGSTSAAVSGGNVDPDAFEAVYGE